MSDDPKKRGQQPGTTGSKKLSESAPTGRKVEKRSNAGFALDGGDIRKPKPTQGAGDSDK